MACRYDRCPCEGLWRVYPTALLAGVTFLVIAWFARLPLPLFAFGIPLVCPPVICGAIFCSLPHAILARRARRDFPRARALSKED